MSYTYQEIIEAFGGKIEEQPTTVVLAADFAACAGLGIVDINFLFDESLLRGALLAIPANDYKVWIDMAISLRNAAMIGELTEETAYEFWRAWSETDASYDESMCERKWAGITPAGAKGLGSIYYMAKEHGWNGRRRQSWTIEEWIEKERIRLGIKKAKQHD